MQIVANQSASFPSFSGSGPRSTHVDVTFPAIINKATAMLTGFDVAFDPASGDHHLGRLDVQIGRTTILAGNRVARVDITFGLRDWSGNWDDRYEGTVFFTVIAE
jgi:hypothetical protein